MIGSKMFINHPKVHGEQSKHTVDPCGQEPYGVRGDEHSFIDNHDVLKARHLYFPERARRIF